MHRSEHAAGPARAGATLSPRSRLAPTTAIVVLLASQCGTSCAQHFNHLSTAGTTTASFASPAQLELVFVLDGWRPEEQDMHRFHLSAAVQATGAGDHEEVTAVFWSANGAVLDLTSAFGGASAEASAVDVCRDGPCAHRVSAEVYTTSIEPIEVRWSAQALAVTSDAGACRSLPSPAELQISVVDPMLGEVSTSP